MKRITVLAYYDRLSIFHSLKPLIFSRYSRYFTFTNDPSYVLEKDKNSILIMFRWFLKPDMTDLEFMKKLRKKYDRIAFFNGNAGGAINRPEVLPYVDLFYNKALFKDKTLYKQELYGDELFSDFHHKRDGVIDESPVKRQLIESDEDLKKLRLSWNIGVTDFPNTKFRQRVGVALSMVFSPKIARWFYHRDFWKGACSKGTPKKRVVHGRLGFPGKKSISYQRRLIVDMIKDDQSFLNGQVNQKQFNRELMESMITLSPFGWGELCKRDFEAVYFRSLLLKPDMSHLETWPDIFIENETYVPFKWDLSDMKERAEYYLKNEDEAQKIVDQAFDNYKKQLEGLNDRFESILKEIIGE